MPHTTSPPFRRRLWPAILSLTTLLPLSWPTFALAHPQSIRQNAATRSAADYLVHDLPGAPKPQLEMYAGHVEVTPDHHGNLFFWFYKSREKAEKERLVIWFNGGPGCSSMDGALMEVGPYRVNEDGTLRYQEAGWDEYANVLFIDNPVGTGFSFVDGDSLVHELPEMADQIVAFLETWFGLFPEYAELDMYIAGESYAGQHIPYIARAILERNSKKASDPQWGLSGLLIGNGWISGVDQYSSYVPFMYEQGILKKGTAAANNADAQQEKCNAELANGGDQRVDTGVCESIMMGLSRDLSENGQCYNVYDVRLKDSYPSCGMTWPPDLKQLTPYLRRDDVRKALNLSPDQKAGWTECNNQVNFAFSAAHSAPSKDLLPDLLTHMPIVLFSGDKDLICNHIGTENLISNMEWNGGFGMKVNGETAPIREWTMDNEPAGQYQEARNLTYLRFYNSSHMVPFDYPKRARDMLDRFMGDDIDMINGEPKNSVIHDSDDKEVVPPSGDKDQGQPGSHDSKPPPSSPSSDVDKAAQEEEDDWKLYYRSGEAALLFLILALAGWGFFVWRSRRRRGQGYKSVMGDEPYNDTGGGGARSRLGLATAEERFRNRERDLEDGAEELDELDPKGEKIDRERFDIGDDDDWDESDDGEGSSGKRSGHV